jgi:hypothetical protein
MAEDTLTTTASSLHGFVWHVAVWMGGAKTKLDVAEPGKTGH